MELKHIKELMAAMERTGTKKLMLKNSSYELQLERDSNSHPSYTGLEDLTDVNSMNTQIRLNRPSNVSLPRTSDMSQSLAPQEEAEKPGVFITSPMVGTFYGAPSPEDPSFVKVGDQVDKGSVVCIIEAMKVMNEIKANVTGVIAEILVESGHPVEFGTKLFRVT
ncbi:MAG: acetyl-CoA carboxylase biotin carboxyl carrier protein [Parachlamydiaceae bacterium]